MYSLYFPCTYLRQNAPFYVDFSLDGHLKNGHLLSTLFLEYTNEMKRFTLKNNVIIKGMNINKPPRSFADIASKPAPQSFQESSDTEPVTEAVDVRPSNAVLFKSTRSQVMDFINSKMGVQLEEEDICAAHELKPGRNDKVPPLVVRSHTPPLNRM